MLPTIVTVNPFMARRRKRRHNPMRHARRAHYRAHNRMRHTKRGSMRRHRRRTHNPFSANGLMSQIGPVLIGAGGAIATDVAMAYLPVPAQLQSGWMNILTRAAVAVGVGYIAGMAAGKRVGQEIAAGGLVVVAYAGLKQALAPTLGQSIKGLSGLADFGDYTPSIPYSSQSTAMSGGGMGAYMRGMGAYMQPRMGAYSGGMGAYMNPAAFVGSSMGAGMGSSSPIVMRQRAMSGLGAYGAYDSDSM